LDIQRRTSQDVNHNGMPDECESGGNFILIPNPALITPQSVAPYQFIQVHVDGTGAPAPITNVWANGVSLTSTNSFSWDGVLRADTRPGPQTVYILAEDATGRYAAQIGTYTVVTNAPPLAVRRAGNMLT